jgi:hypothetical protein
MSSATMDATGLLSKLTYGNAILLIFAYFGFKVVRQIVYYRWFHPLSKFPGPFWASVTRLWVAYRNVKEDEYLTEYKLHKKYGELRPLLYTYKCSERFHRTRHSHYAHNAAR